MRIFCVKFKDFVIKNSLTFVLCFTITVIFTASFQYNGFKVVNSEYFNDFQKDSESLVIGKIIYSKNHAISDSVGLGWIYGIKNSNDTVLLQYQLYLDGNKPAQKLGEYTSSFSLQGYVYSYFDNFLDYIGFNPHQKLQILTGTTAFIMALLLAIFCIFIRVEFGNVALILSVIAITYSRWLVVFANNLYWVFFLMIAPFILTFLYLKYQEKSECKFYPLYLSIFALILIKSLCGFEYLSTIFISFGVAFIYFAIKNSWQLKAFISRIVILYLSALFGFVCSIGLYIYNLSAHFGFDKAIDILKMIILKRTYGNPSDLPEAYRAPLEAPVLGVIKTYLVGKPIFDFGFIHINALFLIILFAVFTIISICKYDLRVKTKPLLISLWVSILAPPSWFVLAKGHSYIHTHMNYVLWHIPFIILGFILVGVVIAGFRYSRKVISIFFVVMVLTFISLHINNAKKVRQYVKFATAIQENENAKFYFSLKDSDLYFGYELKDCKKIDLNEKFFLHIIPQNVADIPKHRQQFKFDNLDFSWNNLEIKSNSILSKKCVGAIRLPNYPISKITTGQFNNSGQIWSTSIDLNQIAPFNLSDQNWQNGISKREAGFFIKTNFINRQNLRVGDKLKFAHSGVKKIIKIDYSSLYINIFVDGEKLDALKDGYPNKIEILR